MALFNFQYTGRSQRITIPAGFRPRATAYIWGGGGASGGNDTGAGGNGACGNAVKIEFNVSAGDVIEFGLGEGGGRGMNGAYGIVSRTLRFTSTSEEAWTVPAGVTSISFEAVGGGGGGGGYDTYAGGDGQPGKIVRGTLRVSAGQILKISAGAGGDKGIGNATNSGGGVFGPGYFKGGSGSNAGPSPYSGGGGGGGGASSIRVNDVVQVVAAGGGGGGGAGQYSAAQPPQNIQASGNDGTDGQLKTGDGAGAGGGGGGYPGGAGGLVRAGDNGGYGGSSGTSFTGTAVTSISQNDTLAGTGGQGGRKRVNDADPGVNGYIIISYSYTATDGSGGAAGGSYIDASNNRYGGGTGGNSGAIGRSGSGGGGGGASVLLLNNTIIAIAGGGGGGGGGGNTGTIAGENASATPSSDNVGTVGQNGQSKSGDGGGGGGGGGGKFGGRYGGLRSGDQGALAGGTGTSYTVAVGGAVVSATTYTGSGVVPPSIDGYTVYPNYASGGVSVHPTAAASGTNGTPGYMILVLNPISLPYVKQDGTWSPSTETYINVDGNWEEIVETYVKVAGQWKQVLQPSTVGSVDLGVNVRFGTGGTRAGPAAGE